MSTENEILAMVLARVAAQPTHQRPEIVYLVSQAAFAATFVLAAGATLFHFGGYQKILICGAEAGNGYEGRDNWLDRLHELGIPRDRIDFTIGARVGGGHSPFEFNTLTEVSALVEYMQAHHNGEHVTLVAPEFHLPRVMVTLVSVLRERLSQVCTPWGYSVAVGNWKESIVHSQGSFSGSIQEIFKAEMNKIQGVNRYKNLAPLSEVLEYLDNRK